MVKKKICFGIWGVLLSLFVLLSIVSAATLQWDPVSGTVTGYRIYYGINSGNYTDSLDIGNVTQYSLLALPLTEKTTYYFVLRAYNDAGESENSNELSWTVPDNTPPVTPTGVFFEEQSGLINWSANSETDLETYRIYFGTSTRVYGPFITNGIATSYSVAGLDAGTTYYFAVTALDTAGNESGPSDEITVLISSEPDLPPTDTPPPTTILNGLVGSWLMSGGDGIYLLDYSGNNNTAVLAQNGATPLPAWVSDPEKGVVVKLEGAGWDDPNSGNYIDLGPLDIDGDSISLGILFKLEALPPEDGRLIAKQSDWLNEDHFWMVSRYFGGKLRFRLRTGGVVSQLISSTGDLFTTGEWVFAVATYDGQNMKLYCNGIEVGEIPKTGNIDVDPNYNAYIGAGQRGTNIYTHHTGEVGFAFVYDRALTAEEITAINNSGRSAFIAAADQTAPTISIVSPTSADIYMTTESNIDLKGTSSDNAGVSQITWKNSLGGSGIATGTEAWTISDLPLSEGENVITVTATDSMGNVGEVSLTVTYTIPDTTKPSVVIMSPTTQGLYSTNSVSIDLSGSASDNVGVTQVRWTNSKGGGDIAGGTTAWAIQGLTLAEGDNVITIIASDAAGNEGVDTLTVIYIPPDTISPTVSISSPTTASNYATNQAMLFLSGTSSDNIGVTQVTWNNSVGGSGIATGTLNWSIADIALTEGENVITVQATDSAGNINGRILVVTYAPMDRDSPVIAIISPTNEGVFSTQTSTIALSGTASDNVGVTQVAWNNSQGGNDIADGNESWTARNISLAEGDNVITVTAMDAAGNEGLAELKVTYTPPDVIEPVVQISSPTSDEAYTGTASTIDFSGTATDNTGISQVIWSNSLGGSGIASGTSDWRIAGIALHEGENLVTVTAIDDAGNQGLDSITVYYEVTDTIAPSIKMTSPTAARFYYTKDNTLDITGTASDNKEVAEVIWGNSKGGGGKATGTENWSISGIELSGGRNTITITAIDAVGNKTSIRLYVVFR